MTRLNIGPAIGLVLLLTAVQAAAQQPRDDALVVTSGEGVVQAPPDRAFVAITAEWRAGSPRDAQRRNADAMSDVQAKLRAAGVPADAIRTVAYDLQQEWDFVNDRRVSRGYVARNTIEVRIDAIERVGDLLEIAVASGAAAVGGVRFDVKDRGRLEREALRLAVADARAKADVAAAAAGRVVARVRRVEEHGVILAPPMTMAAAREALPASDGPPIAGGQLEVRGRVTLTAELK
ncbi:MAG: hypothetical protein A3I61_11380 [Acidobacteria bacterium RIFCSPLOWO2_02_FULL_68_18]|nr:MAG: hypothetical protein A3I61_11380 [Acidobacteria bacterium RIFCSPLOWO2_02_FULL_68_18]OFW50662.1 MAG: hypothetical protein A3G77_17125 [Acidobacteria bacterium RIFCSPLOWO2_12_FULL_68_19]